MSLSNYKHICDAMVLLMHPLVEIAIHDIESEKIIYINGSLSKRKVGSPSLLDKEELTSSSLDQVIYPKTNFDGRLIKSISVPLERKWLLCINVDISLFSKMKELAEVFLKLSGQDQPKSLFINDWQEKLHLAIGEYLQKHQLIFEHLSSSQKKGLVQHLFELGAFHEKNAADYVAEVLKMGRATVFKYLKEWRKLNEHAGI